MQERFAAVGGIVGDGQILGCHTTGQDGQLQVAHLYVARQRFGQFRLQHGAESIGIDEKGQGQDSQQQQDYDDANPAGDAFHARILACLPARERFLSAEIPKTESGAIVRPCLTKTLALMVSSAICTRWHWWAWMAPSTGVAFPTSIRQASLPPSWTIGRAVCFASPHSPKRATARCTFRRQTCCSPVS